MKTQLAYCSTCSRDVHIAFPTEPTEHDGQANITDTEVYCLDIGERCTGAMCPIGAQPSAVMAVRLIRNGITPVMHALRAAQCEVCGDVEKFVLIDATHATCTGCGRTVEQASIGPATS